MADREQLERLTRSVEEWNQWRREYPEIQPDLNGACLNNDNLSNTDLFHLVLDNVNLNDPDVNFANLGGADLTGADLSGANLYQVDLIGSNLSGANLSFANFFHVMLDYVNLNDADLSHAYFRGGDLIEADLNGADLTGAYFDTTTFVHTNLSNVKLNGASLVNITFKDTNLSDAHFFYTILASVDLSNVKGLETTIHDGPSHVDINSVILPTDESIRLHFLRGVGFTETQIEYLPSLLTPRSIEYSSLFISYASQDETIARRLYTDLRKKDVPCWFAPHNLRPGTPILRGIEEAIHMQDKFLLILSEHAVESRWIEREVDAALHQEIQRGQDVLFPIRLDNTVLESNAGWATRLHHRHIGDFTNWQDEDAYQHAFATLLRHLKITKPPTL